jgi:hypothetical protein
MNMAIDITGFQRMRREQAEKAKKEAEEKCQETTAQSNMQTNTSQDASTPKAGAKPATQTKKKPSGRQQKK